MFKFNFKAVTIVAALAIGVTSAGVLSCSKTTDTSSYATFIGDWNIKDTCSAFNIPQIKISAGDHSYSLKVTYKMGYLNPSGLTGYDSCQREVTVDGIVNSNAAGDYFSIGNQVVTDKCGNNYTISGGANIKHDPNGAFKDSLIITLLTTTTGGSSACTYRATTY